MSLKLLKTFLSVAPRCMRVRGLVTCMNKAAITWRQDASPLVASAHAQVHMMAPLYKKKLYKRAKRGKMPHVKKCKPKPKKKRATCLAETCICLPGTYIHKKPACKDKSCPKRKCKDCDDKKKKK